MTFFQNELAIMGLDCVRLRRCGVDLHSALGLFEDAIALRTPCTGVRIPEFRKFMPVESRIRKICLAYGMGNPGL